MFERKLRRGSSSLKNLYKLQDASSFLLEEKRKTLLQNLQNVSGLEPSRYARLCMVLVENLVNYCQHLPETAHSYYSQRDGLFDHALNRAEAALGLLKDFLIIQTSDVLSEEQKLWQYVLYTAAFLQGIGKLFNDYCVEIFDIEGTLLKIWNPLLESLVEKGAFYKSTFTKEADKDFRKQLNILLAKIIMPSQGFSWIASDAKALTVWLMLLNEDYKEAGTLGAILIHADAIALRRNINDFDSIGRGEVTFPERYKRGATFSDAQPETLAEKERALGIEFVLWLTKALANVRIVINKAPLFMVPGGLLITEEIFQLFIREHARCKNWQAVQRGFLALGLHLKEGALSRFEHAYTQQMQNGVVFSKYAIVLPATVGVYQVNTGKVDYLSATELVHKAHFTNQFVKPRLVETSTPLLALTANKGWQAINQELPAVRPGVKQGG